MRAYAAPRRTRTPAALSAAFAWTNLDLRWMEMMAAYGHGNPVAAYLGSSGTGLSDTSSFARIL